MEGYDVNDASVYNQQGSALKRDELNAILCSLCRFILREAMQVTQCGHRFCKNCIEKLMSAGSEEYKCPVDDEPFVKAEVRRDRGCQKEISALEVDCPIRPNPCKWRGPLIEIEVHRLECPQALVWCTLQCGLDLRRDELATHLSNDCVKRPLNCPHCNMTFPSEDIKVAEDACRLDRQNLEAVHDAIVTRVVAIKDRFQEMLKREVKTKEAETKFYKMSERIVQEVDSELKRGLRRLPSQPNSGYSTSGSSCGSELGYSPTHTMPFEHRAGRDRDRPIPKPRKPKPPPPYRPPAQESPYTAAVQESTRHKSPLLCALTLSVNKDSHTHDQLPQKDCQALTPSILTCLSEEK